MRVVLVALFALGCTRAPVERAPPPRGPAQGAPIVERVVIDPSCTPQPDDPVIVHADDQGIVLRTQRAMHCFYLQASPESAPRVVYSSETPPRVIAVLDDDTLVLATDELVRVRADGTILRDPSTLDGEETTVIAAYDDGVVLQAAGRLLFVPWGDDGLAFDGKVELAADVHAPLERVCRSAERIVFAARGLSVFDLSTRARQDHPMGGSPELAVCDDELAVLDAPGVPAHFAAFEIATGARLPSHFAGRPIAVRHRHAYTVDALPTSRVVYAVRRVDLTTGDVEEHARFGDLERSPIALESGLWVMSPSGFRRIPWHE